MRGMSFPAALPHGPITRVVDGVHLVRGRFRMGPGVVISRTMTLVQQPDGLTVLNAVRLDDAGEAELARLGPIKHLVKLSESHGLDEPYYADRFKPEVWAPEGAKLAPGLRATRTLGPACPIEGGRVIEFPGASGWVERGLWIPNAGGTLITCDALQNHVDTEQTSLVARIITPMMGFKGGLIVAPMWRKYQKVHGAQVRAAFAPLADLPFENLVTGHGPALVGAAQAQTLAAIAQAAQG
jgi:hypothetical protein